MRIPLYQIDAFADEVFKGNPAAVCPLEGWLPDGIMQAIAAENNLSETAFFVFNGEAYDLRWFTPKAEVDLCGHATLATAFVIFEELHSPVSTLQFHTCSGDLFVSREDDLLSMDFPAQPPEPCEPPEALLAGLGKKPVAILASVDYFAVYENEGVVRAISPDFTLLQQVGRRGVIVTAKGDTADFVSRFFAPSYGVPEDPVTGSAHCALVPYWAERLQKRRLHAHQVSERGGELFCEFRGDRVKIAGRAVKYLEGEITVPD